MTTTDFTWRSLLRGGALAAALVVGCGGSTGSVVGGESHFLSYCDDECDDGFDCISGVCTRSCLVGQDQCGDLGEGVTCTDQSIEPGEVAVCDLSCEENLDCNELGADYQCDSGYCRLDPDGSATLTSGSTSGSGGSSSGSGGTGATSGGTTTGSGGNGDPCEVLFMEYADGETGIPDPRGCGTCDCSDGQLECSEEGCGNDGVPVFRCPPLAGGDIGPPPTDSIDVISSSLAGDTLILEVGHSAGCAVHEYGMCYVDAFLESFPVQGSLALIHDSHGEMCEAYEQLELRFDLTPYADYYREAYQTETGSIQTNYGLYEF